MSLGDFPAGVLVASSGRVARAVCMADVGLWRCPRCGSALLLRTVVKLPGRLVVRCGGSCGRCGCLVRVEVCYLLERFA